MQGQTVRFSPEGLGRPAPLSLGGAVSREVGSVLSPHLQSQRAGEGSCEPEVGPPKGTRQNGARLDVGPETVSARNRLGAQVSPSGPCRCPRSPVHSGCDGSPGAVCSELPHLMLLP